MDKFFSFGRSLVLIIGSPGHQNACIDPKSLLHENENSHAKIPISRMRRNSKLEKELKPDGYAKALLENHKNVAQLRLAKVNRKL
jgi:hypothetical protein